MNSLAFEITVKELRRTFPLPGDLYIVAPTPSPFQHFSGIWKGDWTSTMQHVLIVEYIASEIKTAQVVYSVVERQSDSMRQRKGGCYRVPASITEEVMTLHFKNNPVTYHTTSDPNTLWGTYNAKTKTKMERLLV